VSIHVSILKSSLVKKKVIAQIKQFHLFGFTAVQNTYRLPATVKVNQSSKTRSKLFCCLVLGGVLFFCLLGFFNSLFTVAQHYLQELLTNETNTWRQKDHLTYILPITMLPVLLFYSHSATITICYIASF